VKKILAIVAVATTLLLTGCSQVGSAATLGSTKISQATVQSSIDAILAARQGVDTSQMQIETGEVLNCVKSEKKSNFQSQRQKLIHAAKALLTR
jgi:hypothetical protein